MLNKNSLKELLLLLNFSNNGKIWEKEIKGNKFFVDFDKGILGYPNGVIINDKRTSNFDKPENFVVFECVHRLVEKGYRPEHIELEPSWKLGHSAKGGQADIQIKDNKEKSLLLIECKTVGSEFNNARKDTLEDGAQLFSYFQQEKNTKFLCLYTSDIVDGKIKNEYHLINVQDNEELLKNLSKNRRKIYKEASTNKELFQIWKDIYQRDFSTRGLFEEDIASYEIGKNKYSLNDLDEVDSEVIQKKYHEFATILRQHNVSGHENAFDKLVNLFLAKIVDETNNPNELNFYWKGAAYDDYFSLQDRLQKLYKVGMEKFLNEDVTYIDNKDIEKAFKLFKNDPDATKDTILKYLRELKFFTNNDFAFIDVHNEHLFYQNAEVLKKIVQMLQNIKLKTEDQNQFLGDLFEGFLDQGVKQSEGQFFTPMPIVKFIVSSLPIDQTINNSEEAPKVIDYACGAGHFLNEYAKQIKSLVEEKGGNISDYYSNIVGIEKEYRLSKVSKVAAFMYKQDEIKIVYADALAVKELEEQYNIKNGEFSILIANPPYSVKGFLETIPEEDRNEFLLTNEVSDFSTNNSIETFFIERAANLLKDGGLAAIILPSAVLSNKNIYIKAREILLKNFDIIAISEFAGGTFGKTGINSITLFLRKKSSEPNLAEHYLNRVNSRFSYDFEKDKVFEDKELLESYCNYIGIEFEIYKTLLQGNIDDNLMKYEIFKDYVNVFSEDTNAKKIIKLIKNYADKSISKNFTVENKEIIIKELKEKLKNYINDSIINIEKEKMYFYLLAKSNPQPVIIVKSPKKEQLKEFLGYEWKTAKGDEGIHYLGTEEGDDDDYLTKNKGINKIKTVLFNPHNPKDETKINTIIYKNYLGEDVLVPEELEGFVSVLKLEDMFDFSIEKFDKKIHTTPVKKIKIESKYDLVKLDSIADVEKGTSITSSEVKEGNIKVVAGGLDFAYFHNVSNRPANTITISASGANAGYINFWNEEIFASDCTTVIGKEGTNTKYLYELLLSIQNEIYSLQRGSGQPHVYKDDIKRIYVPNVPRNIQDEIVRECDKVNERYKDNVNKHEALEIKKEILDKYLK